MSLERQVQLMGEEIRNLKRMLKRTNASLSNVIINRPLNNPRIVDPNVTGTTTDESDVNASGNWTYSDWTRFEDDVIFAKDDDDAAPTTLTPTKDSDEITFTGTWAAQVAKLTNPDAGVDQTLTASGGAGDETVTVTNNFTCTTGLFSASTIKIGNAELKEDGSGYFYPQVGQIFNASAVGSAVDAIFAGNSYIIFTGSGDGGTGEGIRYVSAIGGIADVLNFPGADKFVITNTAANGKVTIGGNTAVANNHVDALEIEDTAVNVLTGIQLNLAGGSTYKVEADGDATFRELYINTIRARSGVSTFFTHRANTDDTIVNIATLLGGNKNSILGFFEGGTDRGKIYWDGAANEFVWSSTAGDIELRPTGGVNVTAISKFGDGGTTNYLQIAADGELTLFGTAMVTKSLLISATTGKLGSSSPTSVIIGNYGVLQFVHTAPARSVHFTIHMPIDWASGTDMLIKAYWAPTNANAGNVVFDIDYTITAHDADELISGAGTNDTVTDATQSRDNELLASPAFTIAGATLAAEDTIGIQFSRDTADAADTYGAAISLVHLEVEYTADKLGE